MIDLLKNIDGKATQQAIEATLRQYRTFMITTPDEFIPSITAKYTLEMPTFSNVKQSSVEMATIKSVDHFNECERFFNWFNRGLCKLTVIERRMITLAYLEMEPMHNYEICMELNVSERTFYRMRTKALYKLALALGKEVYQEDEAVVQ
ncbi:ArpU family phage packaging/lysis transcriptional regulator [Lysinibacillus sp. M3]|uniref:ArpU family phage packaging/lysis transcriptional regulator n=1 Tax=Lysinibacillus zambalensis TaxID=3160866 RepID=A0ABV1MTW7_9BACI